MEEKTVSGLRFQAGKTVSGFRQKIGTFTLLR